MNTVGEYEAGGDAPPDSTLGPLVVRQLGRTEYTSVWTAMREFTDARNATTPDELWLTEHDPVFTQGQAGKAEHVLLPGDIPIVRSDRGGQVTYHGPGQLVAYPLIDIVRGGIGVRAFVTLLETTMIALLASYGVRGAARADAPGVYVDGMKIGSLGLRIRRGRAYHGLSLNVDMDLAPFARINPCGMAGMTMTQLSALTAEKVRMTEVVPRVANIFTEELAKITRP